MKLHRIYGITLRHLYYLRRHLDRSVDVLFFPIVDLILWGITSAYFQSAVTGGNTGYFVIAIVSAILFWMIVGRISSDMPFVLLDDLWSRNLINIFGSPLTLAEWLVASLAVGLAKAFLAAVIAAILAFFLYQVNIIIFGFYLVPFVFLLVLAGTWLGLGVTAFILRYGQKVQSLAWSFGFLVLPFSAIYYPVAILPEWAQAIAYALPTTYLFEAGRQFVAEQSVNWGYLAISLVLNLVFMAAALIYIYHAFRVRMNKGMLKLQD